MDNKFYEILKQHPNDEFEAAEWSINVSVSRNPTYSKEISGSDKKEVREYWKKLLRDFYNSHSQGNVSREEFFDYVYKIRKSMNSRYLDKFQCDTEGYANGFRLAHAQKSLSVFLKHLWCMGKMKEPPFCPIDGIILNDVLKKKGAWTKLNDIDTYVKYIEYVDDAVKSNMSVAEWEYYNWNEAVTRRIKKNTRKEGENVKKTSNNTIDWAPYATVDNINRAPHADHVLISKGYCIPLNKEQFRIYIGRKDNGTLICKIMKKWGKEDGNIEKNPDALKIFNMFTPKSPMYNRLLNHPDGKWHNSRNNIIYKYVEFDNSVNEKEALEFMENVKKYIQNGLKIS